MFPFLSNHGVLGLDARNLLYIRPFNPKKAIAFADDKLKTKAFLSARGIPVAKMYGRIDSRPDLQQFAFGALPDQCVLKPNYGFGGEGILIVKGRKNGKFVVSGSDPMSEEDLGSHIEDILDGKFSVNGLPDTAFFERLLKPHQAFAPFRPSGLPDIRIVVFNLVPVMAMVRIPTAQSGGKANVHLGGIGIGIDLAKGATTHATQYNRLIKHLPHGAEPSGIRLPYWEEMLLIASRIQELTNIGYLAVDLTLDEEQGPVLLEVNARAGLMVQVANLAPLRRRLDRVSGIKVTSPEQGVRIAQEIFGTTGGKTRAASTPASTETKPVLGVSEMIVIAGSGERVEVPCHISLAQERTTFAPDVLKQLLADKLIEPASDDGSYRIKCTLKGRKIQTVVREGEMPDSLTKAVVGRRDLTGFLVDPAQKEGPALVRTSVKEDLRLIDSTLGHIDHELALLKFLKPTNLAEERQRCEEDAHYQPQFVYRPLPGDLADTVRKLQRLTPDDSSFGILLRRKRDELLSRVRLLEARGDAQAFTDQSFSLFGFPAAALIGEAEAFIASQPACDLPAPAKKLLPASKVAARFTSVLAEYGLHDWSVRVSSDVVADCVVGGSSISIRESALFSEERVQSLIAHEIETHVLTSENGSHQPYDLLRRGCAGYLDTQEGLAVWNEERILSDTSDRKYHAAKTVLGVAKALDSSFVDLRRFFEELGFDASRALTKAIQTKRGLGDTSKPGAFTKGLCYFRGRQAIMQYAESGGDMRKLYLGKVAVQDLDLIQKIEGLHPPILVPAFLRKT